MTQRAQFDETISQQMLFARLAEFFGLLAIVLVATGLYGTLAYRVNMRTAEIGVRMAVGARRGQVVWMILRDSLLLTAIGWPWGFRWRFWWGGAGVIPLRRKAAGSRDVSVGGGGSRCGRVAGECGARGTRGECRSHGRSSYGLGRMNRDAKGSGAIGFQLIPRLHLING